MKELNNGVQITYFGHATFSVKSPSGINILIDPWTEGNPLCPEELKNPENIDVIAITHGHQDHIGDLIRIANNCNSFVISTYEINQWISKQGVKRCLPINKGGSQTVKGIKFIMTHAQHSSSIETEDGSLIYAGEPGGYVIKMEDGFTIYHAGDTNIFGDMKLIGEIYSPDLVMLPIGDVFTMSPFEASHACRLLKPKYAIPMHYGTFPILTGKPSELTELTKDIDGLKVLELKPGETLK